MHMNCISWYYHWWSFLPWPYQYGTNKDFSLDTCYWQVTNTRHPWVYIYTHTIDPSGMFWRKSLHDLVKGIICSTQLNIIFLATVIMYDILSVESTLFRIKKTQTTSTVSWTGYVYKFCYIVMCHYTQYHRHSRILPTLTECVRSVLVLTVSKIWVLLDIEILCYFYQLFKWNLLLEDVDYR